MSEELEDVESEDVSRGHPIARRMHAASTQLGHRCTSIIRTLHYCAPLQLTNCIPEFSGEVACDDREPTLRAGQGNYWTLAPTMQAPGFFKLNTYTRRRKPKGRSKAKSEEIVHVMHNCHGPQRQRLLPNHFTQKGNA